METLEQTAERLIEQGLARYHRGRLIPVMRGAAGAVMTPAANTAQQSGGGTVPFLVGSQLYREQPFYTQTLTMGASQQTFTPVPTITPGNFLNGVVLEVTSASGVLGTTATINSYGAAAAIQQISLTDTGGGEILYPLGAFQYILAQKYLRPWTGDPFKRSTYSNTVNPAFTMRFSVAIRDTLCILSNTDARTQYRMNIVLGPLLNLVSVSTGVTAPAVTVNLYIDAWAEPDAVDLAGRPIQPLPPGLGASRFLMHQTLTFNGGNNTFQLTLTGNEIRGLIMIVRNSAGTLVDLTDSGAGNIRFRLDNRSLWVMLQSQIQEEMANFYAPWYGGGAAAGAGTAGYTRETGVYVIPRFRDYLRGEFWLPTVEQTLLQIEIAGTDLGTNAPGTVEFIYDQLAVAGQLPAELEGV